MLGKDDNESIYGAKHPPPLIPACVIADRLPRSRRSKLVPPLVAYCCRGEPAPTWLENAVRCPRGNVPAEEEHHARHVDEPKRPAGICRRLWCPACLRDPGLPRRAAG